MGKSHISLKEKKISQVAHSCTYMFVYLKIKRKDKCSLCKLGLFFFFASYRKLVWWMGGFSGALNSANRYLMYDIKLIYENKTGVHTYFVFRLEHMWLLLVLFCIISFLLLLLYPLSILFLFTWIVVENSCIYSTSMVKRAENEVGKTKSICARIKHLNLSTSGCYIQMKNELLSVTSVPTFSSSLRFTCIWSKRILWN